MQVLFEAKKKPPYNNRLLRAYFSNVFFIICALLTIAWAFSANQYHQVVFYFIFPFLYAISRLFTLHKFAKRYVHKISVIDNQITIDYLFRDEEHSIQVNVLNIPCYEKDYDGYWFFNLPNNERFTQYLIGDWNEDSALDLIASLDKIRNSAKVV